MISVYNTATKKLAVFKPHQGKIVQWYNCGPTVYNYIHIGNARNAVCMDFIRRYLEYRGYSINYIQNYTDIDDKMISRAKEMKISVKEVADKYIAAFEEDALTLGVHAPTHTVKATEHIPEMVALIKELADMKIAYTTEDGVYFAVKKFRNYGKLSGQSIDQLKEGARVAVDEKKKDPLDFALWKFEKPGEPSWDSPWGRGRPGWHIECSAMSTTYAKGPIDIHSGGIDLLFPHHENEAAQYLGAGHKEFSKYWIHNAFLNIHKEKMSKSLGNVLLAKDAIRSIGPLVLRYFFVSTHYRSPIDFSADAMESAKGGLFRYQQFHRVNKDASHNKKLIPLITKTKKQFIKHMDTDFDSPEAFGVLYEFIRQANTIGPGKEAAAFTEDIDTFLGLLEKEEIPKKITQLAELRELARTQKKWKEADQYRNELADLGYTIEDLPQGYRIRTK